MSSKTTQSVNAIVSMVISVSLNMIAIALVVMAIYFSANWSYNFGNSIFNPSPVDSGNGRAVTVVVPQGAKLMDIAKIVKKAGVIEDEYVFAVQLFLSDEKDNLTPGTYTLSTTMLPSEIIKTIAPEKKTEEKK